MITVETCTILHDTNVRNPKFQYIFHAVGVKDSTTQQFELTLTVESRTSYLLRYSGNLTEQLKYSN